MKQLISIDDYKKAINVGRASMSEPYATEARFVARSHSLSIKYSNGMTLVLDVRQSPILSAHPDADLSSPYVTPGGDGILFDNSRLSFGLPNLVAPFLPVSLARQRIASDIGRVRSPAKAAAAKANGAKGGRPKKVPEVV
jgi:hypothetical protein